jgi:hypothetical protein
MRTRHLDYIHPLGKNLLGLLISLVVPANGVGLMLPPF